jgi:hypothetical protein
MKPGNETNVVLYVDGVRYLLEQRVTKPSDSPVKYELALVEQMLRELGDEPAGRLTAGGDPADARFDYRVVLLDEANTFNVPDLMGQPWIFLAAKSGASEWEMTKNLNRGPASNRADDFNRVLNVLAGFRDERADIPADQAVSTPTASADDSEDELGKLKARMEELIVVVDDLRRHSVMVVALEDQAELDTYLPALEGLLRVPEPDHGVVRAIVHWISRKADRFVDSAVDVAGKAAVVGLTAEILHLLH